MMRDWLTFHDPEDRGYESACWIWRGPLDRQGYGSQRFDDRNHKIHRLVYATLRGPIPSGLHLHHLCEVPACVNPDHLMPVDPAEHVRLHKANPTCCVNGHVFDEANTYINPKTGRRDCRACDRERHRRAYRPKDRPPPKQTWDGVAPSRTCPECQRTFAISLWRERKWGRRCNTCHKADWLRSHEVRNGLGGRRSA